MPKIFQDIFDQIQKSSSILLHLHPSPDGDSLGSALAMYLYLKSISKKVTLIKGDSDLPQNFKNQPGFNDITPKNIFDLELSQFDLFIALDTSAPNQISKLGEIKFPPSLKTIVIDHHATKTNFGQINYIDDSVMSTCQLVFELLNKWKVKLTPEIAVNLFIGIYTDTGGFKYQKTTFRTFEIAAILAKINPDFPKYIFEIENNADPGQITFKGLALNSISLFFNDHVAISSISHEDLLLHQLSRHHSEKSEISNILKSVVNWDIGIAMVEYEPGIVAVSMRTRDAAKYNLNKIGEATGAGGGHPAAAGATIYKPLPEAQKFLLEIIQKLHPDLGSP